MRFNLSLLRFFSFSLLLALSGMAVRAQSDRGTIAGTVLDSSGAVVQGASVTATGANTGSVYKTTSTNTGAYRISDMQVGAYNLTVTAAGFRASEQKGPAVQINTTSSLDLTPHPGAMPNPPPLLPHSPTLQ